MESEAPMLEKRSPGVGLVGLLILVPLLACVGQKNFPQDHPAGTANPPIAQAVLWTDSVAESAPENGRFRLAEDVYAASKTLGRPAEARALAGAFRQTADKVRREEPGLWSTLSWIKSASQDALPESSREKWADLQNELSAKLTALYGSGKLGSPSDWAECFAEIARGLDAAGESTAI
jgi:hypothetical protein